MDRRVRRIGLLGGECSGKTTLAERLGTAMPGCVVPEHLRDFVSTMGRPPHADEQAGILVEQRAAEDRVAEACTDDTVVADPAVLMTAVYSLAYFDDDSLLDQAIAHARAYSLLIWCDIDLPWVPEPGQRDGPEHRARVHSLIGDLVRERLQPAGIDVVRVSGPTEARVATTLRAWRHRGFAAPT
ncbi:MAG: ATP-binding protein [Actinomycetota bacterium]|nr:ATP-binding protein [Actinomycetota bacterium]